MFVTATGIKEPVIKLLKLLQYKLFLRGIRAVDTGPFVFYLIPDWYKTQEVCDKVVFEVLSLWNIVLIDIRQPKSVKKLFMLFYQY